MTKKAIKFIINSQLPEGNFYSSVSSVSASTQKKEKYETIFVPCLIAEALLSVTNTEQITKPIYEWLLKQRSSRWTYNYWPLLTSSRITRPYPDDLDDTSCVLSVLNKIDSQAITGEVLAHLSQALFNNEVKEGGPYRTWIVNPNSSKKVWLDVDFVVNINIARLLAQFEVELPNITSFLEKSISSNKVFSPYYSDVYMPVYFASKIYKGKHINKLQKILLDKQQEGNWRNPHNTALAVTSLLNLGFSHKKLKSAVDYLLREQKSNGSWEAGIICIDSHSSSGEEMYSYSSAYTTSVCLEALSIYDGLQQPMALDLTSEYEEDVISNIMFEISKMDVDLVKFHFEKIFGKILDKNLDHKIVMLPKIVNIAFGSRLPDPTLKQLSEIGLWGWMGYTISDDIIDSDIETTMVPVANALLRRLHKAIGDFNNDMEFSEFCTEVLGKIDEANLWELTNCRRQLINNRILMGTLPDYKNYRQLAERSLGHLIMPFGVLHAAKINIHDIQAVNEFFQHYLIARQINDDAHDWLDDLKKGHLNSVSVLVLDEFKKINTDTLYVDLDKDTDLLTKIMWDSTISYVEDLVTMHINKAMISIKKCSELENDSEFINLLQPIENSVQKSLRDRTKLIEFSSSLN